MKFQRFLELFMIFLANHQPLLSGNKVKMSRNIVKILEKNFSDLKAGQKMLISSPEKIAEYIKKIPEGTSKTSKEMRLDLAKEMDADNSCPVSTGIFLRKAIEEHGKEIPFWRLIDENHPVVKKLNLDPQELKYIRNLEGID